MKPLSHDGRSTNHSSNDFFQKASPPFCHLVQRANDLLSVGSHLLHPEEPTQNSRVQSQALPHLGHQVLQLMKHLEGQQQNSNQSHLHHHDHAHHDHAHHGHARSSHSSRLIMNCLNSYFRFHKKRSIKQMK